MSTLADIVFHPIEVRLEGLCLMGSPNDEPSQFFDLLFQLLLPCLQVVNLPSMVVKATINLFQVPLHHLRLLLHQRNQLLDLQGESSKLGPICLSLEPKLVKLLVPGVQKSIHKLLGLQLGPYHGLQAISL